MLIRLLCVCVCGDMTIVCCILSTCANDDIYYEILFFSSFKVRAHERVCIFEWVIRYRKLHIHFCCIVLSEKKERKYYYPMLYCGIVSNSHRGIVFIYIAAQNYFVFFCSIKVTSITDDDHHLISSLLFYSMLKSIFIFVRFTWESNYITM